MSDPSMLLLLSCTTCLGNSPSPVQINATTNADCVQSKGQREEPVAQPHSCISPPEAIATPASRLADQSLESATALLKVGSQGHAVTRLQNRLQQLGYYTGTVDGQYGSLTRAAVSKFQHSRGVNALPKEQRPILLPELLDAASKQLTVESSPHKQGGGVLGVDGSLFMVSSNKQGNRGNFPPHSQKNASPATGLTFNFLNIQPQLFLLVGGVVISTGSVALFFRRRPFGQPGVLEDVAHNLQPGNIKSSTRRWQLTRSGEFDQSVILQQSPIWLQMIIWGIVSVTSFTIIWACLAQVDEAIPAQGKLEPQGTVNNVQAPIGGVVKEIYVKEGQQVKAGDLLLSFDQTSAQAQLKSLQSIHAALVTENNVYRRQMQGDNPPTDIELPRELALLTQNRAAIVAENRLYQLQLQGGTANKLSTEQQQRLQSAQSELNSRIASSELTVHQAKTQLSQNKIALADARQILAVNQEIFDGMAPLVKQGAIARVQLLKQQQEVSSRQAEADRLIQEQARLELEISRSKEQLKNTISAARETLFVKIDDNKKRIAEIDSQLTKAIVENEKRLAEIDSQISQAQQTLRYQDLRSPADGTVFDLKANNPGFVANNNDPILKIVPKESLIAKVFVTNQHIGFIKPGMQVDVRTDTFPYSEFGDIKGELVTIGSDALPPDSVYPFYRFPAKIHLQRESISINGREVPLQSGMSVSTNIKVRKRTVMSILTSLFTQKIDAVKSVR